MCSGSPHDFFDLGVVQSQDDRIEAQAGWHASVRELLHGVQSLLRRGRAGFEFPAQSAVECGYSKTRRATHFREQVDIPGNEVGFCDYLHAAIFT